MRLAALAAFSLLTAPATAQQRSDQVPQNETERPEKPDVKRRSAAEQAGVRKSRVPPAVQAAFDAPYSRANTRSCAQIAAEVASLNKELGPDLDTEPYKAPSDMGYYARRAGDVLLGPITMVRDIAGELTGARKSRDRLEAAVLAGSTRRGYLKGLGAARGCGGAATPTAAAMRAVALPQDSEDERDRREDAAEGRREKRG